MVARIARGELSHPGNEFKKAPLRVGVADPNGSRRGSDGGKHPLEELAVVVGGNTIFLRQLGNLLDQTVDLSAGLFKEVNINLRLRTCTHRVTSTKMGRRETIDLLQK